MISPLIQITPPPSRESDEELIAQIQQLRKERNAVIMAHNYQIPAIQDLADFVGDSLALAREATRVDAEVIVLCGVSFMAETAKLLNPQRTVIIPDPNAGCSLADSITAEQLREWKAQHPGAVVVSYVNTTAAVKAETDICCTSSNAEKVIRSIPEETPILFCPDMFLGDYLKRITGRQNMEIWAGECHVHAGIRPEEVRELLEHTPDAELLIHPECGCTSSLVWAHGQGMLPEHTFMLSTDGMIRHARASHATNFIVATETGLLHRMQRENPTKRFFPADRAAVCVYMKMITLPKLRDALRDLQPQVTIPEDIAVRARRSIERMLAVS
ncbi:MAG: quinolinate synthase [Dehalococcoidia bacterium]|nr:MAG: quinolinate synthase [Dehalococcoidia bacterium]